MISDEKIIPEECGNGERPEVYVLYKEDTFMRIDIYEIFQSFMKTVNLRKVEI